MKTMTKNSKNSNISKQTHSSFSIEFYERQMINAALGFLIRNNVYFYDEAFLDIKELVMDDLARKNASKKDKDEVADHIDSYFDYYKDSFKANTNKVMIQELGDIFYCCIGIIRDASMNGKKSTSNKSIDDYYKEFIANIDRYKKGLHNIEEVDVLYSMFEIIRKCKYEGGDFHMIDTLYNKLGEYLEANYKD